MLRLVDHDTLNAIMRRLSLAPVVSSHPLTAPANRTGSRMLVLESGERWAIKFDDSPTSDGQGWWREYVGWRRARRAGIPCAEEVIVLPPEEPWNCGVCCVKQIPGVTGDLMLNSTPSLLPVALRSVGKAMAEWHTAKTLAPEELFTPFFDHLVSKERFAQSFEARAVQLAESGLVSQTLRARLIFFLDQNLHRFDENTLVPIHGDANIANMLFDRFTGALSGLLDFETLSVGPARYDLAPLYGAMSCAYYTKRTFVNDPDWMFLWEGYTDTTEFRREDRLELTLYTLDALLHAPFVPDYWYSVFASLILDGIA